MTIYKAGLFTTVFSQVINAVEKEYLPKLCIILAGRSIYKSKPESRRILPYLGLDVASNKKLYCSKNSETNIPNFEWKEIISTIRKEGFGDLMISNLGFIVENTELTKIIEEWLKKKIAKTKFVILFKSNPKAGKEDYIRRELVNVMKSYVDNLNFQYATLELAGIYTLQDWRSEKKHNLLNMEELKLDESVKEIITSIFKPTIRISGKDVKIRFIKWYELKKGNMLSLAGYKTV